MEEEINEIIKNNNTIKDGIIAEKIELKIQTQNNVAVPSIILEYTSTDNRNFEMEDLKAFFNNFGEVLNIILIDKKCVVLFKTFFIANICKEFLEKKENFRENMKNNFNVRWLEYEKDESILLPEIKPLFKEIYNKNIINLKSNSSENKNMNNQLNNNSNNNIGIKMNMNMNINNFNINTNMNPMNQNPNMIQNFQYLQLLQFAQAQAQMKMNKNLQNNNIPNMPPGIGLFPNYNFNTPFPLQQQNMINMLMNKQNFNNNMMDKNNMNMNFINNNMKLNNLQKPIMNQMMMKMNIPQQNQILLQKNLNQNNNNNANNKNSSGVSNDEKNIGKYTCKYEILIANDKDFQIARRLIGSKGCNMKKIINECKIDDGEGIKLRLRGKGSGYKEGPENKESDEPLHLCISSKNPEEMKKACLLVDELLNKIHEDYKEYCEKNNVMPLNTQIATRIDNKNSDFKSQ